MKPFWIGTEMDRESTFFIQTGEGKSPLDFLLFTPENILSVTSTSEEIVYEEGRDYILTSERTLSLPEGSRIPFKTNREMHPEPESPQSIAACRDGVSHLFFGEGHVFHDLQVSVTYTHKGNEWQLPAPEFQPEALPGTISRLTTQKPMKIVLFGDSISAGANASGMTGAKPFMPPYGELVVNELIKAYDTEITYRNHSVGGTASGWGLENINAVAEEKPDLAILAFGMNDASGRVSPERYRTNIQKQMERIREVQPEAEFILVATMTGNPEWTASAPELYPRYRDELRSLCKIGVALADLTSVWIELLKRKRFTSITGNGVNHPNDFGHRIYAQIIMCLLTAPKKHLPR